MLESFDLVFGQAYLPCVIPVRSTSEDAGSRDRVKVSLPASGNNYDDMISWKRQERSIRKPLRIRIAHDLVSHLEDIAWWQIDCAASIVS